VFVLSSAVFLSPFFGLFGKLAGLLSPLLFLDALTHRARVSAYDRSSRSFFCRVFLGTECQCCVLWWEGVADHRLAAPVVFSP